MAETQLTIELLDDTTLLATLGSQLLGDTVAGYDLQIPNSALSGVTFPFTPKLRLTADGDYRARVLNAYIEEYGAIAPPPPPDPPPTSQVDAGDVNWETNPTGSGLTSATSTISVTSSMSLIHGLVFDATTLGGATTLINITNYTGTLLEIQNCLFVNFPYWAIRILVNSANIRIRNCKFLDGNTGAYGDQGAIFAYNAGDNIWTEGCWFENQGTGFRSWFDSGAATWNGFRGAVDGWKFNKNWSKNMFRPRVGESNQGTNGQTCQFAKIIGSGHKMNDNISIGVNGECAFEDHISWFNSSGESGGRAESSRNKINGAGPSASGAGISVGDGGGGYIDAFNNVVVRAGNGIQLAGGTNNNLSYNTCYSPQTAWSQVGCLVLRFQAPAGSMHTNTVGYNRTYWLHYSTGYANHSYYPAGASDKNGFYSIPNHGPTAGQANVDPTDWSTNVFGDATLSDDIWDPAWNSWTVARNYVRRSETT